MLVSPAGASATTAPARTIPASATGVSRGICTTSPTDPQGRAVAFTVRMSDLPPTSSYGFAVRLQERVPGAGWKTLKGAAAPAGFSDFQTARSGAQRMVRRLNVQGLHPGSSYRLRVVYRWLALGGYRETSRTSGACVVRDVRPNVALQPGVGWIPSTTGGEVAYRVPVHTDGLDALKGVDVGIEVRQGNTLLGSTTFRPAAADDVILVPGRRCVLGVPLVVVLDPAGTVDDRVAADDRLQASCVPVSG